MSGRMIVRRLSSLAEPLAKRGSGRYPVPNNARYKKLMEKQAVFCRDDGLLVWQKLPSDMIFYRGMCIVIGIGTLLTADALWRLASPPQNG